MLKYRLIYLATLVVLGLLVVFTVFRPMVMGKEYSEVQRVQLLEREDQWILQFDIINREGRETGYNINVFADGERYAESVLIRDGGVFTYVHHIYPERLIGDEVTFAVYREGESAPIEQGTYVLK